MSELEREIRAVGEALAAVSPSIPGIHCGRSMPERWILHAGGVPESVISLLPGAGGKPLRQPRDHRRNGRPPALRRQCLSGTASKGGGPDYLMQFVEPRVVTENTMRHGLVV